jgi:hypothetical protein
VSNNSVCEYKDANVNVCLSVSDERMWEVICNECPMQINVKVQVCVIQGVMNADSICVMMPGTSVSTESKPHKIEQGEAIYASASEAGMFLWQDRIVSATSLLRLLR